MKRDIVTAVTYYYITTEFHKAKRDSRLSAYGDVTLHGLNLKRFLWGKTRIYLSSQTQRELGPPVVGVATGAFVEKCHW